MLRINFMRIKLAITVVLLALFVAVAACSPPTVTGAPETNAPAGYVYIDYTSGNATPTEPDLYRLEKAVWGPYSIYLFGSTSLPVGARRLDTRLYKDGQPVDWWKGKLRRLADGRWELRVKANEWGTPEELPGYGRGYSLYIGSIDKPVSLDSPGAWAETRVPESGMGVLAGLEDSRWELVSLNGNRPLLFTKITLEFSEGTAGGMSDCNRYGGWYVTGAPDLIEIYEISTTQLSCGERSNRQSEVYLGYLGDAITYRIADKYLVMYDVITNNKTLVFKRKP